MMASLSKNFHTCTQVWNKYGSLKAAWVLTLPYLPYLPYLHPPAHTRERVRTCARMRVCMYIFSMVGMEVWKKLINKGTATSTLIPHLYLGMEVFLVEVL
jgi:hypothetical protein